MVKENEMLMMSVGEHNSIINQKDSKIKELEIANEMLRKAILQLTSETNTSDVRVSRKDFIQIHNDAVYEMHYNPENENNDIYGYDMTVHWHGIYCNCSDGATPYNHLIPGIEACDEELDEEDGL